MYSKHCPCVEVVCSGLVSNVTYRQLAAHAQPKQFGEKKQRVHRDRALRAVQQEQYQVDVTPDNFDHKNLSKRASQRLLRFSG